MTEVSVSVCLLLAKALRVIKRFVFTAVAIIQTKLITLNF